MHEKACVANRLSTNHTDVFLIPIFLSGTSLSGRQLSAMLSNEEPRAFHWQKMKFIRVPPVEFKEQSVPVLMHNTESVLDWSRGGAVLYNPFFPCVNIW